MEQPPVPVLHAERLLEAFGYWHSFHDAEVHRAVLDRGGVDERPSITLLVNVYDRSRTVDERGYYDVRVNVRVTLRFAEVDDVALSGLGGQNVIDELRLAGQVGGRIAVELVPCFGLSGAFTCAAMEIVDVAPYAPPIARPEATGDSTSRPAPAVTCSVTVEAGDSEKVPAAVRRGIRSADPPGVGPRDYEPVVLALRDEGGAIVGGAYGATMWGWLMLDGLWVDVALRGRGLGARLLGEAEAIARRRGCRAAWLDTFDFQARPFYERQGYHVVATLEGFPAGHTHYRMRKDLDPA